ncbi:hypothetical protein LWI28_019567 [Acer negundo]|uniref:Uncharacterized protein n=1 Tax=Acer negundo TaxID=4023 RepID=A0AAD5J5W2_ACENE|nr:hypothetical protein LWI28_019567 [Acer negundo]
MNSNFKQNKVVSAKGLGFEDGFGTTVVSPQCQDVAVSRVGFKGPSLNVWVDLTNRNKGLKEGALASPPEIADLLTSNQVSNSSSPSLLASVSKGSSVADSLVPSGGTKESSPKSKRRRRTYFLPKIMSLKSKKHKGGGRKHKSVKEKHVVQAKKGKVTWALDDEIAKVWRLVLR